MLASVISLPEEQKPNTIYILAVTDGPTIANIKLIENNYLPP
jgi:hypothetical protein